LSPRVGVGLVALGRLERAVERRGTVLLQRTFSPGEVAYCGSQRRPLLHYAARLAARRAALSAGIRPATPHWAALVRLLSDMRATAGSDPASGLSVSLSHESDTASAFLSWWTET
jgi:phosphopantetheinyl transferase (holo-ACP synthase)